MPDHHLWLSLFMLAARQEGVRSVVGNLISLRMTSLRIRPIASRIKNNFSLELAKIDDR